MDVYDDFPNPLFDGHTWISPWFSTTSAEPYVDANTIPISTDTTVYATWEETEYTITYIIDDQENWTGITPETFVISDLNVSLPSPTHETLTFDGWYADETFTEPAITEITTIGNKTFYGKSHTT
jgi:uncharacterized repeat protein (TIGR02543 family)